MVAGDAEGDVVAWVPKRAEWGANALYPGEAKSNTDLVALKRANPEFILVGGLEKEVINEGNEGLMKSEITSKVPLLLELNRYFPNIDHTLQPMCTYDNVRRFMTLLHEAIGNPEGTFPRWTSGD